MNAMAGSGWVSMPIVTISNNALIHKLSVMKNLTKARALVFTFILLSAAFVSPSNLHAHGNENHEAAGVSLKLNVSEKPDTQANSLPENIANLGGPFSLVDHSGRSVTEKTYSGKHMLVFFGYTNCQIMCSISLKRMADALKMLQHDSGNTLNKLHPLVITVDPKNDTPEKLQSSLGKFHSELTGLTGTQDQLKQVYKAYGQNPSILEMELNTNSVVSHSSYFYLMGPDGKLQTLFPPVLSADSMANLIRKYVL